MTAFGAASALSQHESPNTPADGANDPRGDTHVLTWSVR